MAGAVRSASCIGWEPELADGSDIALEVVAVGVELQRQFGERTVAVARAPRTSRPSASVQCARIGISHRCASPRAAAFASPRIELDGGMEASTPRATSMAPWASASEVGVKRPGASLSATATAL